MDDTETTESQTTETNESQTNDTNDTSSNSEPSFSSDALSNGNSGPNFDIDWDNFGNDKTNDNDTGDNDTSDENRKAAQAWVDMHQHYDWGSGLTVDDVFNNDNVDNSYSTGDNSTTETNNQSRTENQGDYATSSKENSNVQTTTIGKQDEITTTPDTITENKGIISNSNIQSVEGLDFQQKDKDDLKSKKERDKAEEEDKSDQLKNELRNDAEKNANANKDGKGFQVGNDYIDKTIKSYNDKQMANLNNQKADLGKQKAEADKQVKEREAIQAVSYKNRQDAIKNVNNFIESKHAVKKADFKPDLSKTEEEREADTVNDAKSLGLNINEYRNVVNQAYEAEEKYQNAREEWSKADAAAKEIDNKIYNINKTQAALEIVATDFRNGVKGIEDALKSGYITPEQAKNMINSLTSNASYSKYGFDNKEIERSMGITKPETPTPETPAPETPATKEKPEIKEDTKIVPEELPPEEKPAVPEELPPEEKPAVPEEKPEEKGQELVDLKDPMKKAEDLANKANSIRDDIRNGNYKDEIEREEANDFADSLDNLSASMKNAAETSKAIVDENGKVDLNKCTPQQIEAKIKADEQLSKNLNDALSKSRAYEQHYGNKQFTRDIAKANDFKVPGTDKTYTELATEMATKSPQIAKAMYDAKADRYKEKEENAKNSVSRAFYNIMYKIENLKSNMSQSLIGSKLTFADNKVRNHFNKMADLNMKATYAAYGNRLNHPEDYQPEDLEEARQQIDQAHALQYASAALKASTGALSGLGDSIKDGVYGTTNAKDLSYYQQVLADIGAFSQIVLGMGVSSLANKGYNTFNNLYPGSLFSKDIDKDGFSWTEEYGNNPAAEAILSVAQLAYGVSLLMNPMTFINGVSMIKNAVQNGLNAAYGVRNDARKLINLTNDITSYFEDVKQQPGIPPEAIPEIDNAIEEIKTTTKTEDFKINSDEVGNLDNWLEGSGSNTADNSKFNQALKYEDWLKLIQADPAMKEYAKKLAAEKNKNAQENNADTRVNS